MMTMDIETIAKFNIGFKFLQGAIVKSGIIVASLVAIVACACLAGVVVCIFVLAFSAIMVWVGKIGTYLIIGMLACIALGFYIEYDTMDSISETYEKELAALKYKEESNSGALSQASLHGGEISDAGRDN
jgi:hypothetical protein